MSGLTFIHTADLHLDSPFKGMRQLPKEIVTRLHNSTFLSFQKIVKLAIKERVDFVLISGDLFDGENRNLLTQVKLRQEFQRLNQHNIQVYIIHGNHDHLGGKWISVEFPENVHIFSEKPEMMVYKKENGVTVHLYGFSYGQRHLIERSARHYKKVDGADFHIGLLHGSIEGNTEHSPYSPFSLKELLDIGFDYWALGHIHKRTELSLFPPIIYPGNIQGRHKKEIGEKGCYLVRLQQKEASLQFVSTHDILWEKKELKFEEIHSFDELLAFCQNERENVRQNNTGVFLELVIRVEQVNEELLFTEEDLLELLQEDEEGREDFVWVHSVKLNVLSAEILLEGNQSFYSLISSHAENKETVLEALLPLYAHSAARRLLENLSDEELQQITEEAKSLLFALLSGKGGITS
jgi:exonuclease SbcD